MKLKERLKDLLKERDLSVSKLSREVKVSRKTLDNWLLGRSPLSLDDVNAVAAYFQVSIGYLLGFEERQHKQKNGPALGNHIISEEFLRVGIYEVYLKPVKNRKEE